MLKVKGRKRIFDVLGFAEEMTDRECTLRPPNTDSSTPLGKQNRRKFLRAWVEIHAWLTDFKRLYGDNLHYSFNILLLIECKASQFKDAKDKSFVQLDNAREMYQTAIGAHPDQGTQL